MRIHRHRASKPRFNIPKFYTNERIRAEEVRVLDAEGKMLGILKFADALKLAKEKELDLVEVSPKANPPVCKILDYGQFKYQKEKEARKQKAQSKEIEVKGVRLTFKIGKGDFDTRVNQAKKFLDRGDKVKVELPLRGREKAHRSVAIGVVNRFLDTLKEEYKLRTEQAPTYQSGRISAIITKE
jgi:translation initiation factor IF-3